MDDERRYMPRDVIVFAIRDSFPDHWAEADDFADVLLANFASHGYGINLT